MSFYSLCGLNSILDVQIFTEKYKNRTYNVCHIYTKGTHKKAKWR